jgi:hypothetical protein
VKRRHIRDGSHAPRSTAGRVALALGLGLCFVLYGCGSGGSGSSGPPPPPPSFTIAATPSAPSIAPGTSSTVQVSVVPSGGFSGTVSVTATGLPSGLGASPASFTLQTAPQSVTLTADQSMATGNYSFDFDGTSGNLSGSATVNVAVALLQTFTIVSPQVLEVVTIFGSTASAPLETQVCCPPGPDNYSLNFSVQGLPTGVTGSFSPNPIAAGGNTTLTLTAPANGQWIQNLPINVVATPTAQVPTQSLALDLVVAPPPGSLPNSRSDYLRTDDTPRAIVYDSVHQLIFSSDYYLNRVDVVSTSTRQIVKSVPVLSPGPMALTADSSEVLVGSDSQLMSAISTTSYQVIQQWMLPRLSGQDYGTKTMDLLSNGTLAVQLGGPDGGFEQFAIWNSANNTMSPVTLPLALALEACYLAGGGTNVVVADCSSASAASVYNTQTGQFGPVISFPGSVLGVAASPDGSEFLIFDDTYGLNLYNNQLQLLGPVAASGYLNGFIFSPDGSHIYVTASDGVPVIFVCDGSTGGLISTAPAIGTIPPGSFISPSPFTETPFAVDSTGIIFGSADHGIAFDDSTYSVNYVLGFNGTPEFDNYVIPSFGPVDVATPVSFNEGEGFSFLPDVWFGSVRGTGVGLSQGGGTLTVTTPAFAQPGPVNVKVMQPDGTPIFNPLVFSYGPAPMFVDGDTVTPLGGVTADIIGLGLPTNPSQIQVSIGGASAGIVSASPVKIQGPDFPWAYPYPAVDVRIALPPGTGDQDLQITTSAGSATLSKVIHYAKNVTDYKSPDTFQAVLLDRKRGQLYLSAGNHIDVFSLTTQQFLPPFTPPALNGEKAFYGLALTPDNSELLAANLPDGSVALINPDQSSPGTAVQIFPAGTCGNGGTENIVTTNTGEAFIAPAAEYCVAALYELNLSSLQVTTINGVGTCCIQALAASGDGSKLLITPAGSPWAVTTYDVASNTWATNKSVLENFGANAAVSIDGSAFATGNGMVEANANLLGYLAYQDVFQTPGPFPSLPLEKIPDGGSLVYIPYANYTFVSSSGPSCVDIFDVNHGARLRRINLAEQVQQVTDAMAIDPYGQNIYLITNAGLSIVQLSNAPLSIGHLIPSAGPAGTSVTIRGSGFQQGASVSANGTAATATFVDQNTLQATMPNLAAGSVQITVTNPAGATYSLDNAFTIQ